MKYYGQNGIRNNQQWVFGPKKRGCLSQKKITLNQTKKIAFQ
jgi:hypothetical protein